VARLKMVIPRKAWPSESNRASSEAGISGCNLVVPESRRFDVAVVAVAYEHGGFGPTGGVRRPKQEGAGRAHGERRT
jgi:hypothetical protein